MAVIYRAQISPSKLEVIGSWLPNQSWFGGGSVEGLASLGAYRFDDPAGDVGIETLLVSAGDRIVQVPMTYRGAALAGADEWLMATMEHSVLGRRWVYDACADPVYASALAATIFGGGTQADEFVQGDDGPTLRTSTVLVTGSGSPDAVVGAVSGVEELTVSTEAATAVTTVATSEWVLEIPRVVDPTGGGTAVEGELRGTWATQAEPVRLASGWRAPRR